MNPKLIAAIASALVAASAWATLRAGECVEVRMLCASSIIDGNTVSSPHEEVVTICGDRPEDVLEPVPGCKVYELGTPYAAPLWKDRVTTYATEAEAPRTLDTCVCSTGIGCEWTPDEGTTWLPLRRKESAREGTWRGAGCVPIQCGIHDSMVTGVGATNTRDYNIPAVCGGPGKKSPVAAAAKVEAEVP